MRLPRYGIFIAFGLLVTTAACSFILDHDADQCSTDGDCSGFGGGAVCRDSVCVSGSTLADGQVEGATNEAGSEGGGSNDASPCQKGGFGGNPTTNAEYLNHCTASQCAPFDNCDKLGLCGDAGFLSAVDPDAGSSTTTNADSGATQLCEDLIAALPGGDSVPVYVTGSSNFPSFLKLAAPLLAADSPPHVIVWQQTNSCTGIKSVFDSSDSNHVIKEGAGKSSFYYDATGNQVACFIRDVDPAGGHAVDVGEADIFADSCAATLGYQPVITSDIGSYTGPIQAMTYIVPGTSSQVVISSEAAQAIYGHGGVPIPEKLPWIEPNQFFNRTSSTGTNQLVSRAMNVEPTKWWGVDKKSAAGMISQLKAVPQDLAEKTIGVVTTDLADQERGNLKVLAFQAKGQTCGFWPDSTPFATDKRNVRDGHYQIWGTLHFYTRLQGGGVPSDAAGAFVLRFAVPRLDQGLVEAIAKSGNIPQCAMKVTRDTELGDLKNYTSPYDCDCIFEKAATGKLPAECKACSAPNECPTDRPACNYGFCEAN